VWACLTRQHGSIVKYRKLPGYREYIIETDFCVVYKLLSYEYICEIRGLESYPKPLKTVKKKYLLIINYFVRRMIC